MLENIKSHLIVAAISIVGTIGVYTYILNNQKARNSEEIAELKGQVAILDKLAKDQEKRNEEMTKNVADLKVSADQAHSATQAALVELAKLKKPVVLDPVDSIEEVKDLVAEHYNDNTTTFDPGTQKFSIAKSTTFSIVDDAIEWKVNGPIFKENLFKTESTLKLAQVEIKKKDDVILGQDSLIKGLNTSLTIVNDKCLDKDKIITLYEKNLKIESMNGNLKFVLGLGAGAGAYLIYDRIHKR